MAELTNLESKLAEVVGLAMAAQGATKKVAGLAREEKARGIVSELERMRREAKEAERRGTAVAGSLDGKKTAVLEKAREVKKKADEMLQDYLDESADALDGLEFLTMAEAGEVGHWEILGALNRRARDAKVSELVRWGLPIQKRHLRDVRSASLQLARAEDPHEPAE
jgi:phosphate uptake regulator